MGDCVTVIAERPDGKGGQRRVEVDDVGRAFLRFARGATGSIEGNWIATGRKMQHDFEVYGTKGALAFSQERFNELHFFSTDDRRGRQGFRRIEAGPDHPPYGLFCVAPGHQLGFNDLKAIEVAGFLGRARRPPAGAVQLPRRPAHPDAGRDDPRIEPRRRLEGGSLTRHDGQLVVLGAGLAADLHLPHCSVTIGIRGLRVPLESRGQRHRQRLRQTHRRRQRSRERVFVFWHRQIGRVAAFASGDSVLSEIAITGTFRLPASSTMLTTSVA